MPKRLDAVVVGAGPNGLAAAIALARTGRSVQVFEAASTPGGGCRSAELTEPGFIHDICAAVHPTGAASPFFAQLPLREHGLRWIQPPIALAHPLDDGSAVVLDRSVEVTAEGLGPDAARYRRFIGPLVRKAEDIAHGVLGPVVPPRRPAALASFGMRGIWSMATLARTVFRGERGAALLGGIAAHSMLPMDAPLTGGLGVLFGLMAHAEGWPVVRGGSQKLTDALVSHLRGLGGDVECDRFIDNIDKLPAARAVLCDVTPRALLSIAPGRFSGRYGDALRRFRYGPGVFKVDWSLDGPVPWKAPECGRAGTVHLAGTFEEIARSEVEVSEGRIPEAPLVILAQQSLFDDARAPNGKHTLWGYCHVPSGSTVDMTERIEAQIERFAPGFRDVVRSRSVRGPAQMEAYNPNYVGGDINAGLQDLRQFVGRPALRWNPYTTPDPRLFLCSSSTSPGGGVHGMCGYWAARAALSSALR